ncbi:hypothetical protein DY245_17430, partial [Streptomyces inhibens]
RPWAAAPAVDRPDTRPAARPAAAAGEVARRIAAVWSEVLSVPSVGHQDNFFDLGGNSLLLSTLHSRLQTALGVELPMRRMFEHPTVASLADFLAGQRTGAAAPGAAPADESFRQRAARARQNRPPLRDRKVR